MSMLCTIFRVTPSQKAAILDDPNLVADLLDAPEADLPCKSPKFFCTPLLSMNFLAVTREITVSLKLRFTEVPQILKTSE